MSWLLDTNAISETTKPRPNLGVLAWLAQCAGDETRMFVSSLSVAEIYRGFHLLPEGSPRRSRLRAWAQTDLETRFSGRILAFDESVARTWGAATARLPRGVTIPTMDSLIAATALHHGLVLVTRNIGDMRHFADLAVENPWS
ncbi:MAG: type II toxin-antitoxin system VapC family toxin [Proteobacteria bacterium]|nr:type II toxin-antitoxin system VapC family toxin [Pseudomonadota bacterium]